jgi:hypothetical protein
MVTGARGTLGRFDEAGAATGEGAARGGKAPGSSTVAMARDGAGLGAVGPEESTEQAASRSAKMSGAARLMT